MIAFMLQMAHSSNMMSQILTTVSNSFLSFVDKLSFSFIDFLDIFIVSMLFFFVLSLFRKTGSMPIFFGIFLLMMLYSASIFLNLRVAQNILNMLFSMLLVVLVVIFQKELRRFFELLGLIGLRRSVALPVEAVFKTVGRAVEYLSEHKLGALMVFPGQENIDRFLEGGLVLDGRLSRSLLLSIFDKHSPGHDGAAIIEGDRVRKFSVHLPLAENIEAVKKRGTRHRAALGIAEVSDALVVIVSEETGSISIARDKKIFTVADIGKLEDNLRDFYENKFPRKGINRYVKWFKKNFALLTISSCFAVGFWLVFSFQTSVVQRKFVVPLQFKNLSQEYVVEDFSPEDVVVVLSGRESDFGLIDDKSLKATIDLADMGEGWHRIILKKESINKPPILTFVKFDPESVRVNIENLKKEEEQLLLQQKAQENQQVEEK